ncbi:hypothetical protein Syun_006091 [Stephania yunnanensis]|uniref:Uncharacterized protein n=1 Tax=Stephania yunnanensis TaxID=152371 RepID=A0AAP0KYJ4_9MAGN
MNRHMLDGTWDCLCIIKEDPGLKARGVDPYLVRCSRGAQSEGVTSKSHVDGEADGEYDAKVGKEEEVELGLGAEEFGVGEAGENGDRGVAEVGDDFVGELHTSRLSPSHRLPHQTLRLFLSHHRHHRLSLTKPCGSASPTIAIATIDSLSPNPAALPLPPSPSPPSTLSPNPAALPLPPSPPPSASRRSRRLALTSRHRGTAVRPRPLTGQASPPHPCSRRSTRHPLPPLSLVSRHRAASPLSLVGSRRLSRAPLSALRSSAAAAHGQSGVAGDFRHLSPVRRCCVNSSLCLNVKKETDKTGAYFCWHANGWSDGDVAIQLDLVFRTLAWVVIFAYLYAHFANSRESKFPLILRIWWGFFFLFSCSLLLIDLVLYSKHRFLPIHLWILDVISVAAGLFFLYAALFGKKEEEEKESLLEQPLVNNGSSNLLDERIPQNDRFRLVRFRPNAVRMFDFGLAKLLSFSHKPAPCGSRPSSSSLPLRPSMENREENEEEVVNIGWFEGGCSRSREEEDPNRETEVD